MNSIFKIVILALVATSTLVHGRLSTPSTTVTKVKHHVQQLSKSDEKLLENQANMLINKDERNRKIIKDLTGLQEYGMWFSGLIDYDDFVPDQFKDLLKDTLDDEEDIGMEDTRPDLKDMLKKTKIDEGKMKTGP